MDNYTWHSKMLTIFSVSNYMGEFDNNASTVTVDKNCNTTFHVWKVD